MNKQLYILLAGAIFAGLASANIGETYKQSCARYGRPTGARKELRTIYWSQLANELSVVESFNPKSKRCDMVVYGHFYGSSFTEDELLILIANNMPDRWHEVTMVAGRRWISQSGVEAILNVSTNDQGEIFQGLSIMTSRAAARINAAPEPTPDPQEQAPAIDQLPQV